MRALYSGDDGGWKNDLTNSLALSAGKKLTYTPTVTGNRRQFTIMCNVRRVQHGTTQYIVADETGGNPLTFMFDSSDRLRFYAGGGSSGGEYTSTRRFRDVEHMFIGLAYDSVARTIKMVVNDQEIDDWTQNTAPTANFQTSMSYTGARMAIGAYNNAAGSLEANVSDFVILDGEVLTPQEMINYRTQNVPHGNGVNVTTKKFTTEGTQERWLGFTNNVAGRSDPVLNNENQYIEGNTAGWRSLHSSRLPNIKFQIEVSEYTDFLNLGVVVAKAEQSLVDGPTVSSSNPTGLLFTSASYYATMNNSSTVVQQNALGTPASGDVISLYFDIPARKFYMSRNGTYIAGHDPVAGTGGIDITTGDLRLFFDTYTFTGATLNIGQTDYAYPVAGYGALKEPAKSDLKRCKLFPMPQRALSGLSERSLWVDEASGSWWSAYSNFVMNTGKLYIEFENGTDAELITWGLTDQLSRIDKFTANATFGNADDRTIGIYMDVNAHRHQVYGNTGSWPTNDTGKWAGAHRVGEITKMAIDFDLGLWWYGSDDEWVGDPSAGTGGLSIPTGQDWKLWVSAHTYGGGRFNFGDSPWKQTPPTGFAGPASLDFDTLRPTAKAVLVADGGGAVVTNGDLTVAYTGTDRFHGAYSNLIMREGIYYAEVTASDVDAMTIGVFNGAARALLQDQSGNAGVYHFYYDGQGGPFELREGPNSNGPSGDPALVAPSNGDVLGLLVDVTNSVQYLRTPDGWYGNPVAGTGGMALDPTDQYSFGSSLVRCSGITWNFGADAFTYSDQGVSYQVLDGTTAIQKELEYGPNGCQLLFEDSSNLGLVTAGNKLPWSLTGLTSDDQLTDTPGDAYAVISTLAGLDGVVLNGGMTLQSTSNSFKNHRLSLPLMEEGTYLEFRRDGAGSDGRFIKYSQGYTLPLSATGTAIPGYSSATYDDWSYSFSSGETRRANMAVPGPTGIVSGQWGAMAYKNGKYYLGTITGSTITWFNSGDPVAETGALMEGFTGPQFVGLGVYNAASNTATINCGQVPFQATPPAGFKELKSSNKPTPKYHGQDKIDVIQYLGDSQAGRRFYTTANMKYGVYMSKGTSTTYNFKLWSSLAVMGATNELRPNDPSIMATDTNGLTAFHNDGYTGGAGGSINVSGVTYQTWMFGNDGTEVINNEGSIPTQVIADSSGYMNFLSWEGTGASGATVGTGMDDCELFITKSLDNGSYNWHTWHKGLTDNYYTAFDTNAGQDNSVNIFPVAGRASRVMQLATSAIKYNNLSAQSYFGWAMKSVPGLLSIQIMTGNGSTAGWYMQTDFFTRIAWIKRIDAAGAMNLLDTELDSNGNPMREQLDIDTTAAVSTAGGDRLDIDASGIKCRSSGAAFNANGGRYLVVAFAKKAGGGNLPALLGN